MLPVAGSRALPRHRARRRRRRRWPSAAISSARARRSPGRAGRSRAAPPAGSLERRAGAARARRRARRRAGRCSSSTSRPGASTRPARPSWPSFCGVTSADRATLIVTHDLVFAGRRRRPRSSDLEAAGGCACLGSPPSAALRPRSRRPPGSAIDPAQSGPAAARLRRRDCSSPGGAWLETGPDASKEIALVATLAAAAAAGACAVRGRSGRAAGDGDHGRAPARRSAARAGVATGALAAPRVELLPRPGPVDAVADARLGRLRRRRGRARAGASRPDPVRRRVLRRSASRSAR